MNMCFFQKKKNNKNEYDQEMPQSQINRCLHEKETLGHTQTRTDTHVKARIQSSQAISSLFLSEMTADL